MDRVEPLRSMVNAVIELMAVKIVKVTRKSMNLQSENINCER